MMKKGDIIKILSACTILLCLFLTYGLYSYVQLRAEHDELTTSHNELWTEFHSYTDFGNAKIRLPIDSNDEAIQLVQSLKLYEDVYDSISSSEDPCCDVMFRVRKLEGEILDSSREKYQLPDGIEPVYSIIVEAKGIGSPNPGEKLIIYIDAKTGHMVSSQ